MNGPTIHLAPFSGARSPRTREHHMFHPELTTDQCTNCRTCTACTTGVHSCCFPVTCVNTPARHGCNCAVCHPEHTR